MILENEKVEKLKQVILNHKGEEGALIPVLHEAQDIFGYLPQEVQKIVAEGLNVPLSDVYGVVTFYSRFSLNPKGKYKISVCLGTACYVNGSDKILASLKDILGIGAGECTPDGKFSIEAVRCLGACGLAPVMTINEKVFGGVTPGEVSKIIHQYIDDEEAK